MYILLLHYRGPIQILARTKPKRPTFALTAATKKGMACQKDGSRNDAANICCIPGSPIMWPVLSSDVIAAYKAALELSDIQYDVSESAETLLPNPDAKMKTA